MDAIVLAMRTTLPLGATLFGRTRERVLGLCVSRFDEPFYVREVARLTGGALGAVQRELGVLVQAGILTRVVRGRQVYYQANRQCPVFEELRAIVAKTSGLVDVLRNALAPVESRLGREVNPVVQSAAEFARRARRGGAAWEVVAAA